MSIRKKRLFVTIIKTLQHGAAGDSFIFVCAEMFLLFLLEWLKLCHLLIVWQLWWVSCEDWRSVWSGDVLPLFEYTAPPPYLTTLCLDFISSSGSLYVDGISSARLMRYGFWSDHNAVETINEMYEL